MVPGQGIPNLEEIFGEKMSCDGLEVDPNSLFGKDEMWRRIETCLRCKPRSLSVGSEKGLDESTRASFAFGTGDMDDIEATNAVNLLSFSGCQIKRILLAGHTKCPIW